MTSFSEHPGISREGLEARLGARVAALLSEGSAALPHDIEERLRFAREQALLRVRNDRPSARRARKEPTVDAHAGEGARAGILDRWLGGRGAGAASGGRSGFWLRLASWMPLLILVLGLVLIRTWTTQEQVLAAAELDTLLLSDELPPTAWSDPGFREFLETSPL